MEEGKFRFLSFSLFSIIIGIHFLISYLSMQNNSLTYDESVNLVSGYHFVKTGATYLNPEHPPLLSVISAVPLFFMELNPPHIDEPNPWVTLYLQKNSSKRYRIANRFIFENTVPAERIIRSARTMIILLSCILLSLIYYMGNKLGGFYAGLFSALLYALDPNIIAHSQVVTMDMGLTLFYFLSSIFFIEFITKKGWKYLFLTGIFLSCALLVKFPSVLLFPAFFVIIILHSFKDRKDLFKNSFALLLLLFFSFIFILLFYRCNIHFFLKSLEYAYNHSRRGDYNYLFGKFSAHGWFYYFIVAFFVKTPLGALVAIFISLFYILKNLERFGLAKILLIPPGIFFLASLFSTINIGHRYILPVYPFLFLLSGIAFSYLRGTRFWRYVFITSVLSVCFANIRIYPHYLSFFNAIGGGPERGYKILIDSNIDWGQDLKYLKEYMDKQGIDEVYFAYFGSVDPAYYGIKYRFLPSSFYRYVEGAHSPFNLKPPLPERKVLAVSVSYFYQSIAYRWLIDMNPTARAGYSIFIFDITNNIPARINLVKTYLLVNAVDTAHTELEQLLKIAPHDAEVLRLKEIISQY